ncbi:MAG: ABC transporter [Deltaproteobacteria bacterium]|nr:ABC transporter [Deltaproteobacteria bacterium]
MIRLKGIAKRYGNFQAVHPLDLEVNRGEVFGFLGPNGAGKTTTNRILAGVLPATEGSIEIDGISMEKNPVECRKRIGFIPDRPFLYEKLTAREFLAFIGGIYSMEPESIEPRTNEVLQENGLLDRADELIEAYSHGMKQRLVLSAAILHRPAVLIVDEPMVGLDPHGARRIKNLFRELANDGRTVFLSTHSLDVAQEVCDRVGILYRGRIVALGKVDELMKSDDADLEAVFLRITEEEESAHQTGGMT